MSGETLLKFRIPEDSCQQDFEVLASLAGVKKEVLHCDWETTYDCAIAPGYTHKIENDHVLITVPRDSKETPKNFTCKLLGQPKTDPSRCLCIQAENYIRTSEVFQTTINTTITREEPDSSSTSNVGLIVGLCVGGVIVVFLMFLVVFLYKRCCVQNAQKPEEIEMNQIGLNAGGD